MKPAIVNITVLTRAFSALIFFSDAFKGTKKGKVDFFDCVVYGRFLSTSIASTAPITIITMIIATPMPIM